MLTTKLQKAEANGKSIDIEMFDDVASWAVPSDRRRRAK